MGNSKPNNETWTNMLKLQQKTSWWQIKHLFIFTPNPSGRFSTNFDLRIFFTDGLKPTTNQKKPRGPLRSNSRWRLIRALRLQRLKDPKSGDQLTGWGKGSWNLIIYTWLYIHPKGGWPWDLMNHQQYFAIYVLMSTIQNLFEFVFGCLMVEVN